jgi:hypothetical protein
MASQSRPRARCLILGVKGPGVCLLEYDKEDWLDIYLVNGSTYDSLEPVINFTRGA